MDTSILNRKPDYNFLNQVIDNIKNIDKKNMMQVVQEIYEATYFKYSMLYYKSEANEQKYRELVIKKTEKIDKLQGLCQLLLDKADRHETISPEDLLVLRELYDNNKEEGISP